MKRTAAFFDFDRTLLAADSQRIEALSLLRRHRPNLLYPFRLLKVATAEPFYKRDRISHDRYNRIYLASYKGIPLSRLQDHGRHLYETQLKPRLYPEMLALMEAHRTQGDLIIVASATSAHLLAPFTVDHPPDAWVATAIETDAKGICTGRPSGAICVGHDKAHSIKRLAETLHISLASSHAYSDHHADLPFLESVGHPTVINPTPILAQIAAQRGWPSRSLQSAKFLNR